MDADGKVQPAYAQAIEAEERPLARKTGKKKPGIARFLKIPIGSDKASIPRTAAHLSQFGERKFLNLKDFNDAFHDSSCSRSTSSRNGCEIRQPWSGVSRGSEHALIGG